MTPYDKTTGLSAILTTGDRLLVFINDVEYEAVYLGIAGSDRRWRPGIEMFAILDAIQPAWSMVSGDSITSWMKLDPSIGRPKTLYEVLGPDL